MKKMKFDRLLAMALAVVMIVSCFFVPGESLFAASQKAKKPNRATIVNDDGSESEIDLSELPSDDGDINGDIDLSDGDSVDLNGIEASDNGDTEQKEMSPVNGNVIVIGPEDGATGKFTDKKEGDGPFRLQGDASGITYNVSVAPAGNGLYTINGTISGATFRELYVDNSYVAYIGDTYISKTIDMKDYSVGYHTLRITTKDDDYNDGPTLYKEYVLTSIYSKPSNAKSLYQVYSKYLSYYTSGNYCNGCGILMEFKKSSAKKWKTAGTMSSTYTWYKRKKLSPSKKYKTRVCYYAKFAYNGKTYVMKGPYSGTTTVKTGTKTLPLKSMTVKAYSKRTRKVRYYYYGVYLYTRKYYQFKLKAYVKMKKKPNAAGLYFGNYRIRGNKKTYTKYLGQYLKINKATHYKYRATLRTYQNKTYGGYSPQKTKTVRIK